MRRQLRALNPVKLEVPASETEEESDKFEIVYSRNNPFMESEDEVESSIGGDAQIPSPKVNDEKSIDPVLLGPLELVENVKIATKKSTKKQTRDQVTKSVFSKPEETTCWTFDRDAFDADMNNSGRHLIRNSTLGRLQGWLCPDNELLRLVEKATCEGARWERFDPRAEVYFQMGTNAAGDFEWVPSQRYLASFDGLDEAVSSANPLVMQDFLVSYPYHPSGNLAMADSYIQRDDFEACFKFILRAVGSFQLGMSVKFNPFRGAEAFKPLSNVDLSSVRVDLESIGKLVHPQRELDGSLRDPTNLTEEETKAEVSRIISKPAFGNLLFIKTLHMYAWTLFNRGYSGTACEIWKLVHYSTVYNDVSHSLLHIPLAFILARDVDGFINFNDSCVRSVMNARMRAAKVEEIGIFWENWQHCDSRLDFIFPQWAFGFGLAAVRQVTKGERSKFCTFVDGISADDFWGFIDEYSRSLKREVDNVEESKLAHLSLLRALWLFPSFPMDLVKAMGGSVVTGPRKLLVDTVKGLEFFTKKDSDDLKEYLKADKSTVVTDSVLLEFRNQLIDSYCAHSKDLWNPFLGWLAQACCRLDEFTRERSRPVVRARMSTSLISRFPEFLLEYGDVRPSEFDSRKIVLPNSLLDTSPEQVGSSIISKPQDNPVERWWRTVQRNTGRINPSTNPLFVFIQSVLPWGHMDVSARRF